MDPRWKEMAARLFPPIVKRDALPESELKAAEKRLGVVLPAELRAMYRLAGRRRDLFASHDRLLPPNKLIVARGALIFFEENGNSCAWGIEKDSLGEEDPPVVRAKNEPPFDWEPDHDTVSGFFFTQLLWQHVHTSPCTRGKGSTAGLDPIELSGCHWDIGGCWGKGTVIAFEEKGEILAGATSEEELSAAGFA
jgi:hypothetical protein